MRTVILSLIRFYQKSALFRKVVLQNFISSTGQRSNGKTCRFLPTCSQYSYQAIERYGIVKGILLSVKRISKCHPWSKGGFDPVINQKSD